MLTPAKSPWSAPVDHTNRTVGCGSHSARMSARRAPAQLTLQTRCVGSDGASGLPAHWCTLVTETFSYRMRSENERVRGRTTSPAATVAATAYVAAPRAAGAVANP